MRAARTDANHAAIRDALRQLGATVYDMSGVGRGLPDLLITHRRYDYWVEVKDGAKAPSERKLTPDQADLHAKWTGAPITILTSVDQAIAWWQAEYGAAQRRPLVPQPGEPAKALQDDPEKASQ